MTSSSDQNLLFGIIALQMDFVRREQLVAATSDWLSDKSRKIEEILVDHGALIEEDRQLLAPLVARHLENHGGNPQQSLATLSRLGAAAADLRSLGDKVVDATLSMVGSDRADAGQKETVGHESNALTVIGHVARDTTDARFRILRSHAKGGLGEVYVAQDNELNREVALKEIQTKYADDEPSRLRFLLEAEVTGGLEHPGIVPVYGLGRYEDGRPYYAMRFIRGNSFKEAADRFHGRSRANTENHVDSSPRNGEPNNIDFDGLEFRKLLGRFIDVCQAIEYAHSRGVLHRDLKPANIMLGKYGETLVVDWGLAKAKGRDESNSIEGETTLRPASASGTTPTVMGSAIGTPAFMPPEQAAGRIEELGPKSDVYSLGATLYFLLTGDAPFKGNNVRSVLEDVQKGKLAAPRTIQPQLPKAIEAVCLKAMSLESGNRYCSPQQLADDIERFLADEQVTAFQEPVSIRMRRWVRKHQTLTATTAAVVFVSVVALSVFSTVVSGKNMQLSKLNNSLDAKYRELGSKNNELDAKNAAITIAKQEAETNHEEAMAVNTFLRDRVLSVARPKAKGGLGVDASLRDALYASEGYVSTSFKDQPLVEQSICSTLGTTYSTMTDYQRAIVYFERSLGLRDALFDDDDVTTLQIRNGLGRAYIQNKDERAITYCQQTLRLCREALGEDHEMTFVAFGLVSKAMIRNNDADTAIGILTPVVERARAKEAWNSKFVFVDLLHILAEGYIETVNKEMAFDVINEEIQVCQEIAGKDSYRSYQAKSSAAWLYWRDNNSEKAIPLYEDVLAYEQRMLNEDNIGLLATKWNLGLNYRDAGRYSQSLPLLEEVYEKCVKGRASPSLQGPIEFYVNNLVETYGAAREHERGTEFVRDVMHEQRQRFDPGSKDLAKFLYAKVKDFVRLNAWEDAKELYVECLQLDPDVLRYQHIDFLWRQALQDDNSKEVQDELIDLARTVVDLKKRSPAFVQQQALWQLYSGNSVRYAELCGELGERRKSGERVVGFLITAFMDTEPVLAEEHQLALAHKGPGPNGPFISGMACLRLGRYEDAITAFESSRKTVEGEHEAWISLGLAIAEHHLGHTDEAKSSLDKANNHIEAVGWHVASGGMNQIVIELLLREATQLISKVQPPDGSGKQQGDNGRQRGQPWFVVKMSS